MSDCVISMVFFRLLIDKDSLVLLDLECLLDNLLDERPGAASGVVNVLQDLLWAFHKRGTAAHVFNLALKKNTYESGFTRYKFLYEIIYRGNHFAHTFSSCSDMI
jgi:hypothetical protein